MKIAVAGHQGSFSHAAGQLYVTGQQWDDVEFRFVIDSAGVLRAITDDMADHTAGQGVLPIYNTAGGLVDMTLSAMGRYQFKIDHVFEMNVEQCLMALPNTQPEDIYTITSHQQALRQCKQYLAEQWPKRELREYKDTALAAKDLAEGRLPASTAVIAPRISAELYGLQLVAESIQDLQFNATTFLVVSALT